MSQHTVHARLLHRRIGIANIPLTFIDMHLQHRPPSLDHVSRLKDELNKDLNSRWAYPIDLVVDATVPMPWLRSLSTNRITLDPPSSGRFTCIGGQHRLLAARQLYNEWTPSEENQEMDPALGFYPANIYESSVLDDEELSVWMVERNVARISLKVNLRQRLMVVADLQSVDLQMKALGLLGWSSTDAACIVSLRHSCAWDTVMQVLEEPLYEDIATGTIVDWAVEYRSYPILCLMLQDILQQQIQLRDMAKPPKRITMDFLFGANSAQNQHIRKTGTEYILSRVWNVTPNGAWMHFDVHSFPPFWKGATLRSVEAPGLKEGTPFLFGRMIPSIHDLNFHSFSSPMSDRIHRCEIAASMLHILINLHSLIPLTARRPRRADLEMDWVELIVGGSIVKRPKGEQILRELLINIDALVPPRPRFQESIKYNEYPHMIVIADHTKASEYINACTTPAWNSIIGLCGRLDIPLPGLALRTNPDERESDEEGEDEQPDKTSRAETSKTGQEQPATPGQERPPPRTTARKRTRPEPVVAKQAKRRKRATGGGVQVVVTTQGGTIVEQGHIPIRAKSPAAAIQQGHRTRQPARRGAAQPTIRDDELTTQGTAAGQATPSNDVIPSSQPIIEREDDLGRTWDSYRLPSSPSRAVYVNGGRAYQDGESGRLQVVRNRSVFAERSQDVTARERHDEEISSSRFFLTFAARLRDLTPADADRALEMCSVDRNDIEVWHEGLDELLGENQEE